MDRLSYPWNIYGGVFAVVLGTILAPAETSAEVNRYALLVGCSKYQDKLIRTLHGPENDVAGFERLLRTRFGFDDLETLVGWPEDEARRPTYANICDAFERLVAKVERAGQKDSQVVILLAGHGTQIPLPTQQRDRLDPSNPEPDGRDEAFLPADCTRGGPFLRDNQIGQWLDRLQACNAHVWIVFDSCHSGTMSRGGRDVPRSVSPSELGFAAEDFRTGASAPTRGPSSAYHDGLDTSTIGKRSGSLVAFYAAQEFETAPEVIRPANSRHIPENRHGLLSYQLEQLLMQQSRTRTYRDLGRILLGLYRSERGRAGPTPFFEGDLDREVLGLTEWPRATPLFLQNTGDNIRLEGGELAGVTPGTILAVRPPEAGDDAPMLGYIRALHVTPTAAEVESIAFDGLNAVDLRDFPDAARCSIASREVGGARVTLAVVDTGAHDDARKKLLEQLAPLADTTDRIVHLATDPDKAEWSLVLADPAEAKRDFGVELAAPSVMLVETRNAGDARPQAPGGNETREVFASYSLSDLAEAAEKLRGDLRKMHAWLTMWQIAQRYGAGSATRDESNVSLEVLRLQGPEDDPRREPLGANQMRLGDRLAVRCVNTGVDPLWYNLFFLDGRFGIEHVGHGSIRGLNPREDRVELEVEKMMVNSDTTGIEGYVLIATSQNGSNAQPDYAFLTQTPVSDLQQPNRAALNPGDPFSRLLLNALRSGRRVRSPISAEAPQFAAYSWVTRK